MAKNMYSLASSLQIFTGTIDENLNFFLNNLEQIADLEKWDIRKKALILKLNLSGNALKVISEAKINPDDEYNELVKLLKEKFSKKTNFAESQSKFNSLSQKPNQSIRDLIEEVDRTTNEYLEINRDSNSETLNLALKMKSQKLLDSMRPDIRVEVMKRGATNFQEIGKIAKDVENALNLNDHHLNNLTKSTEIELMLKSQIESNKRIEELTKKIENLSNVKAVNNIAQSNASNSQSISCHICCKRHLTTDCWYYPTNVNRNNNRKFKPYDRTNFRRGFGRNYRNRGNHSNNNRRGNLN